MRFSAAVALICTILLEIPILADSAVAQVLKGPISAQSSANNVFVSLPETLDEALLKSPRATAARAQLPIAKSAIWQATVMPNPAFIYAENFKADKVKELAMQLPVEPPWKMAFRLLAAKRQIGQAELEIAQTLWTLRADVRRAYLDVVIAQELAALQVELLSIYRQFYDAAQARFEAGGIPQLEVEKARLAMQQAEVEQDKQSQRVILAQQHLSIIIGREPDSVLNVPRLDFSANVERTQLLPDFNQELKPLAAFIQLGLKNSPQLRVLVQSIRFNRANLANAVGNVFPNPVLTFGHITATDIGPGQGNNQTVAGSDTSIGSSQQGQNASNVQKGYLIGVNVDIPIFDMQQGNISRLNATIRQLKAEQLSQQNIISDQIANAYRRLVIARRVMLAYRDRVLSTSARLVRMNRESYQYGRSDITAALVGAQLNLQTQNQYLTAVSDYQQALTDLEQAVGTPLD